VITLYGPIHAIVEVSRKIEERLPLIRGTDILTKWLAWHPYVIEMEVGLLRHNVGKYQFLHTIVIQNELHLINHITERAELLDTIMNCELPNIILLMKEETACLATLNHNGRINEGFHITGLAR